MKIELSASHVRRRSAELYAGESPPLSVLTEGRDVLKPERWTTNPQTENPNSQRQIAAMRLLLEIGRAARPEHFRPS